MAAVGVVAATRLVRGGQNNRVPVLTIPTLAAVAYAYWKDLTPTFTIALMIGQVGKPLNDPTMTLNDPSNSCSDSGSALCAGCH